MPASTAYISEFLMNLVCVPFSNSFIYRDYNFELVKDLAYVPY